MELVKEMADAFIMLIRVGAVFRVVYCLVLMGASDEESNMYKKRAKNTVVFYIISECIWQIKDIVISYYS
ncbi:MAG: mercury transporter [Clostridiaceae bacterium]